MLARPSFLNSVRFAGVYLELHDPCVPLTLPQTAVWFKWFVEFVAKLPEGKSTPRNVTQNRIRRVAVRRRFSAGPEQIDLSSAKRVPA